MAWQGISGWLGRDGSFIHSFVSFRVHADEDGVRSLLYFTYCKYHAPYRGGARFGGECENSQLESKWCASEQSSLVPVERRGEVGREGWEREGEESNEEMRRWIDRSPCD
jgi:hypothetical protein